MVKICRHCQRVNPPEALHCYFDGNDLGARAPVGPVDRRRFPYPFVFPSGRSCWNVQELAVAGWEEWSAALDALRQGKLAAYLDAIGRPDLARWARAAARSADREYGLDSFLGHLPAPVLAPAQLNVEQEGVSLGNLRPGEDRTIRVRLVNRGRRLLRGSITVEGGPWLSLQAAANVRRQYFQFRHEQHLLLHVRGQHLSAGPRPIRVQLRIASNGGEATVPIQGLVPAAPFADGLLAGARTPRQLVEKALAHASEAAALFAGGQVARWYRNNGWHYPVSARTAVGEGAMNRYLKALGLAPPRGASATRLAGAPTSREPKRPLAQTNAKGKTAMFARDHRPTAAVPPHRLPPVAVAVPARPAPLLQPGRAAPRTTRRTWLPAVLLLLVALGLVVHDFLLNGTASPLSGSAARPPVVDWGPRLAIGFHEENVEVFIGQTGMKQQPGSNDIRALWPPSMRFGLTMLRAEDRSASSLPKRLTYSTRGLTNNACIRLDGNDWVFGDEPFRTPDGRVLSLPGVSLGRFAGHWLTRSAPLGRDAAGHERQGRKSVWSYDTEPIVVTQEVELVPGSQTRVLDTCLVRYRIENRDNRPHQVGLRFLLDTYIGGNDGVPFTIPGQAQLCDTTKDFPTAGEVPDFIQALERPDLANPGTIAHVQFHLGTGLEPPDRVTLGAWPNTLLAKVDPRCRQQHTLWEVPVLPIKALTPADSAVTTYWQPRELPPGQSRQLGFSYGLGAIAAHEANDRLGLTVGGSFAVGGTFTLTAYVRQPVPGQRLTLTAPAGLDLLSGSPVQAVPAPQGSNPLSPVSWRMQARCPGRYTLRVESSTGVVQTQTVTISPQGIFD